MYNPWGKFIMIVKLKSFYFIITMDSLEGLKCWKRMKEKTNFADFVFSDLAKFFIAAICGLFLTQLRNPLLPLFFLNISLFVIDKALN